MSSVVSSIAHWRPPMQDVSWDRTLGARRTLAEETGRLRYDKALLLRQIAAIEAGMADGTATDAWRALLRTVAFMRAEVQP